MRLRGNGSVVVRAVSRRPLHIDDHGLGERLAQLSELDEDDRTNLLRVLDATLTRKRLHTLANNS